MRVYDTEDAQEPLILGAGGWGRTGWFSSRCPRKVTLDARAQGPVTNHSPTQRP